MKKITAFLMLMVLLTACSKPDHIYKIGVSQCSIGLWRSKVNNEMLAAQHLFDQDVKVEIVDCYDQSDDQIRQIDSLVASGIDLLVVAPNDYKIAPALKRAKDKGIPIVLFDRMVESNDYTAFIGGSNVAIGEMAANYAVQLAAESEGHNVLEIAALQNTSPARERHQGFERVMKQHQDANYHYIIGNWDDNDTHDILKKEIEAGRIPDVVFCHSDFMALGAHRATVEARLENKIKVIGVDGLPIEGIKYVQKGWLAGTCVYPTHGEENHAPKCGHDIPLCHRVDAPERRPGGDTRETRQLLRALPCAEQDYLGQRVCHRAAGGGHRDYMACSKADT